MSSVSLKGHFGFVHQCARSPPFQMRINSVTELGPQMREGMASGPSEVMSLVIGTFPEVLSKRPSPPTGLSKAGAGARAPKVQHGERIPEEASESSGSRG